MKTLEFKSNCPSCAQLCLRDFWVTEASQRSIAIYDIVGGTFKSKEFVKYDRVKINGQTFKLKEIQEVVSYGNTYWIYTVEAGVIPDSQSALFSQPTGKLWNSGEKWYYTGDLPFQLNWGFDKLNPSWSTTITDNSTCNPQYSDGRIKMA